MRLQVLQKQIEHNGCPIVIRQYGEYFEFITSINNLIYSSSFIFYKNIVQKILCRPFNEEQLKKITNHVIAAAQATIDTVKAK